MFENNLARFMVHLSDDEAIATVTKPLRSVADFEMWWDQAQTTKRSMVGSGRLDWPLEDDPRLSLQLQLIDAVSTGAIGYMELSLGFYYGGTRFQDAIYEINRQLVEPFARDVRRRVEKLKPEPRERFVAIPVPDARPALQSKRDRRVFVVHGHDHGSLQEVVRFLERLDLEAVILSEQPNEGRTIIEKFEQESDVGFAVILMTPDDVGHSKTTPDVTEPRARQNVVLELGYFVGALSRSRVCALRKGEVEIPSDLHGLLYLDLDDAGGWRLELAKEMKQAGLEVDLNRAV